MTQVRLILICSLVTIPVSAVLGQGQGSHVRLPNWDAGSNPANANAMSQQLRDRLGVTMPPSIDPDLMSRLHQYLNGRNTADAVKAVRNDPDLMRRLQAYANDHPDIKEKIRENLSGASGAQGNSKFDDFVKKLPIEASNRNDQFPDGTPRLPDGTPANQSSTNPDDRRSSKFNQNPPRWMDEIRPPSKSDSANSERFREFMNRMSRYLPKSMANSDAVKRLSQSFDRIDWGKTTKWKFLPENFGQKLDLGRRLQGTGRFFRRVFNSFEGRQVPDLPDLKAPNLSGGSSLPGFFSPAATSAQGSDGLLTAVLFVAILLVGGYFARKLIAQTANARRSAADGWDPGGWPVDPSNIRTSKELIEAFDHLALRTSGKPARHWHHHFVAKQMGAEDQNRRATADRLAQMYEQARYAPPQEPLVESQIVVARGDLCALAGVRAP